MLSFLAAAFVDADVQSMMAPIGVEAERIWTLTIILLVGGFVIFGLVCLAVGIALFGKESWRAALSDRRMIVAGGIAFPVVVLSGLLVYSTMLMRAAEAQTADENALTIDVIGEQWWWRVIYRPSGQAPFETANEIHIPADRPVRFRLSTSDVIHSFWVPGLAGKLDMIPGRVTTLHVQAARPGFLRGQCAEYCGGAHALMAFHVAAEPAGEFEQWLLHEAGPAVVPPTPASSAGLELFLGSGCGGCHTIRGTAANGRIGPDLTHVGSRAFLAAGTLPTTRESVLRWIADNQHIKPENRMPPFAIFAANQREQLADFIMALR